MSESSRLIGGEEVLGPSRSRTAAGSPTPAPELATRGLQGRVHKSDQRQRYRRYRDHGPHRALGPHSAGRISGQDLAAECGNELAH